MKTTLRLGPMDQPALHRLAEVIALKIKAGDCLRLEGDLGAGKTTFARALIRAMACDDEAEVPSPTFTLVQTYETPRVQLAHVDLYRLDDGSAIAELGLDEFIRTGALLVEWPERAGDQLPGRTLSLRLSDADQPDLRDVALVADTDWRDRLARIDAIQQFLAASGARPDEPLRYLQGDASARGYAYIGRSRDRRILMDWPRQPDGPPIRAGKPYSRIAMLAEDVRPFVAVANALRDLGIATPAILAQDLGAGLLLIEDLGEEVFGRMSTSASTMRAPWHAAVDVLGALYGCQRPGIMPLADGSTCVLPECTTDVLAIEAELLLDWMWPAFHGSMAPPQAREAFATAWQPLFIAALASPKTWLLRDFHSPNLIWRPERSGVERVGVIDFQDALWGPAAYDLVSLLQDARVDVAESLEEELLSHYLEAIGQRDPKFDAPGFVAAYRILGAQRATKILGIFVRLMVRDGKPQYLAHLPRIWNTLSRNLAHPALRPLAIWFDEAFPPSRRAGALAYLDSSKWRSS